jgi:hypothetical protein
MPERLFRKGDRVKFHAGIYTPEGVVKEDLGPLGVGGQKLYLVEYPRDFGQLAQIPMPADELELIQEPAAKK